MPFEPVFLEGQLSNFFDSHSQNYIHSRFDPTKEGSRFVASLSEDNNSIFCFLGLGALHHIEAAISKYGTGLPPLILWEPILEIERDKNFQEKWQKLSKQLDTLNVHYLVILSETDRESRKEKIKSFLKSSNRKIFNILPFPSYTRLVPEEIQKFIDLLNEYNIGSSGINANTISHFQKLWTHNYLKNHSELKNRKGDTFWLNQLKFHNKTPVFVGASPTLEKEIGFLQNYRDQLIVLGSDTSTQYLLSNQIIPDAILSFDAGRGTLYHFLPKIPDSIPILTWLGGSNHLFSLTNPIYLLNTQYPLDQLIEHQIGDKWPSFKNPSLNLAGVGKAIAEMAGSDHFLLCGVNFAANSGKSHCKGTGYETYRLPNIKRLKTWEHINFTKMYSKIDGKNKIAWEKLWEVTEKTKVSSLADISLELLGKSEKEQHANLSYFGGFKGFPELMLRDWERAFQEFPDVIAPKTYKRWFTLSTK